MEDPSDVRGSPHLTSRSHLARRSGRRSMKSRGTDRHPPFLLSSTTARCDGADLVDGPTALLRLLSSQGDENARGSGERWKKQHMSSLAGWATPDREAGPMPGTSLVGSRGKSSSSQGPRQGPREAGWTFGGAVAARIAGTWPRQAEPAFRARCLVRRSEVGGWRRSRLSNGIVGKIWRVLFANDRNELVADISNLDHRKILASESCYCSYECGDCGAVGMYVCDSSGAVELAFRCRR
jgi:hypothetical protein